MRIYTLPPEIIDVVVDHLRHDKPALRACALAHRVFLARCRHHLLRRARLRRPTQAVRFVRLVEHSPRTAACVTSLALEYDSPLVPLLAARGTLPALERLALRGAPALSTRRWATGAPAAGIRSLVLRSCAFDDPPSIRRFLAGFAALEELRLCAVRTVHRAGPPQLEAVPALPRYLATLYIAKSDVAALLPWAPTAPVALTLSVSKGRTLSAAHRELLRVTGPRLRMLRLRMASAVSSEDARGALLSCGRPARCHRLTRPADIAAYMPSLAKNTQLEVLELAHLEPAHLPAVPELLATCAYATLRTVSLQFCELEDSDVKSPAWAMLDGLLATPQFAGLQTVIIGAETPCCVVTIDGLAYCLPKLAALGRCNLRWKLETAPDEWEM
jgi:hypothetical protein